MGFKMMLWAMYSGLKFGVGFTSLINKSFRQEVKGKSFALLIKTKDGKIGRYFIFKNGKVASNNGDTEIPALSLIWADEKTAVKTMKKAGAPQQLMAAAVDGSLSIDGDAVVLSQFIMTVNRMLGVYGLSLDKRAKK